MFDYSASREKVATLPVRQICHRARPLCEAGHDNNNFCLLLFPSALFIFFFPGLPYTGWVEGGSFAYSICHFSFSVPTELIFFFLTICQKLSRCQQHLFPTGSKNLPVFSPLTSAPKKTTTKSGSRKTFQVSFFCSNQIS